MLQIKTLDSISDSMGLDSEGWANRYTLEALLVDIHPAEEVYWRQRGHLNWILKGDAVTKYFFALANGRRRRCLISSLLIDGQCVSDLNLILSHIVSFYSNLLAAQPPSPFSLGSNLWLASATINANENLSLSIPLSCSKIDEVVASSNSNSALGPDGFSITFFKKFWP